MASIAYITDGNMIEFHRLNGHRTMNFWRPTTTKRFADFKPGDILFFLAKGTERGREKEKGIVGFGKYVKAQTMNFSKMWNQYGIENGYATKEELYDAIIKVTKARKMPKSMNCLYLEDVTFFQVPIYLSEIGIKISKRTESYIYLDKEDPAITAKLLKRAKTESGPDIWTMAMQETLPQDQDMFLKEEIRHQLSAISQQCEIDIYNEKEKKLLHQLCSKQIDKEVIQGREIEFIRGNKLSMMIRIEKDRVVVTFPFTSSSKDMNLKKQTLIGHVWYFNEMAKKSGFPLPLEYHVIMNGSDTQIIEAFRKISESNKSNTN